MPVTPVKPSVKTEPQVNCVKISSGQKQKDLLLPDVILRRYFLTRFMSKTLSGQMPLSCPDLSKHKHRVHVLFPRQETSNVSHLSRYLKTEQRFNFPHVRRLQSLWPPAPRPRSPSTSPPVRRWVSPLLITKSHLSSSINFIHLAISGY